MPVEVPGQKMPTYEELLQNLLERVQVHNPEWTNLTPSDPGVTILELFSYLTSQLMQESGRIPDRNRRLFLSLLGVPVQPAIPARGFVTFTVKHLAPTVAAVPPNLVVRAGLIPFMTTTGLDVHPVESLICYRRPAGAEPYETVLLAEPKAGQPLPVCDLGQADPACQWIWIALLARKPAEVEQVREAMAGRTLNIGVLPALPPVRHLDMGIGQSPRQGLVAEMATDQFEEPAHSPRYRRLQTVSQSFLLEEPGILQVRLPSRDAFRIWQVGAGEDGLNADLPPLLADQSIQDRVVTWLRLRALGAGAGVTARFHWIGINADMAEQQVRVTGELLGNGTGEPNQVYTLVNRPVIPGSVQVSVGEEVWQETEELWTAGPEMPLQDPALPPGAKPRRADARAFQVNLATGEIRFGDGLRGARPQAKQLIRAAYAYGGGKDGNLPAGLLQKAPDLPPWVFVTNPLPTWGGADPQTVEEAEQQVPGLVRHRDRLITAEDFRAITLQTPGTDTGRVEVLPHFDPGTPQAPKPGTVTVLVLPNTPEPCERPPEPAGEYLDLIARQLDARRLITTRVVVTGPIYRPIGISVNIEVAPGHALSAVGEAVRQALIRFLSPLSGGPGGRGWPLGRSVRDRELMAVADRVTGVQYVTGVQLSADGGRSAEVLLRGIELPWPAHVTVEYGSLEEASR